MNLTPGEARHLLQRVGFGARPAEVDHFRTLTRAQAVNEILARPLASPAPPAALNEPLQGPQRNGVANWWIGRMLDADWTDSATPNPLQEKMTLLWHGHFCSEQKKVFNMAAMYGQNALFRSAGLGDFEALCQGVALDPAMLKYLDNDENVAGAEQENFGRELMELFTVGIDHYTEDDVTAMARAWTGHNSVGLVNGVQDLSYQFVPGDHDNSQKTLFGITQNWDGPQTITEIVHGTKQQACAEFISATLWQFFAGPDPSAAVVADLAAAFIAGNMDLTELLRALLNHPQFWASEARNALVKSPVEFIVSYMRQTELTTADPFDPWQHARNMGQSLFDPPDVGGWGRNRFWVSSATMWGRAHFVRRTRPMVVANDRFTYLRTMSPADGVQELFDVFGIASPAPNTRTQLEDWFTDAAANHNWSIPNGGIEITAMCPDFQVV